MHERGTANMTMAFDLGANKGRYARAIASSYDKIVCVEANPKIIDALKQNVSDHGPRVIVENYILSDKSHDRRELYINEMNDALSSTSAKWVRQGRFSPNGAFPILGNFSATVTVPTITVDDLIAKHGKPGFIKLDVEGDEHRVLKGLSEAVEELSFEWHEEVVDDAHRSILRLVILGFTSFSAADFDATGERHHVRPERQHSVRDLSGLFAFLERRNPEPWRKRWGMVWCHT